MASARSLAKNEQATWHGKVLKLLLRGPKIKLVLQASGPRLASTRQSSRGGDSAYRPQCGILLMQPQVRFANGFRCNVLAASRVLAILVCDPSIGDGVRDMDLMLPSVLL